MRSLRNPLALVALLSLGFVVAFFFVAALRIRFPYDVEWMEGGVLMTAVRIQNGQTPYPAPSATFVPFLYPPLYPALIALVGTLAGGVSYAVGRSLSLAASVFSATTCAVVVFRTTKRWELAVLTVGLEAALVGFAGSFHDLVRADALAMALVVAGAALALRGGQVRIGLAGLSLAAACFAKQTAFVAGVSVVVAVFLTRERRHAVMLALTALCAGGLAFSWLQSGTQGWFSFFLVKGHQSHRFYRDNLGFYFFRDALHIAPILFVLPLVWLRRLAPTSLLPVLLGGHLLVTVVQRALSTRDLPHMYFRDLWYPHATWAVPVLLLAALLLRGTKPLAPEVPPHLRYWGAIFVGAMVASAMGHATQWAFKNSLMPLAVLGVPFIVLVVHAFDESAEGARRPRLWLAAALLVQLIAWWEPPSRYAPTEADRKGWEHVAAAASEIPGKVMILGHPRLSYELGFGEHVHGMGISDLAALGGIPDLEARLARHEWAAVIVDVDDDMGAPPIIQHFYRPSVKLRGPAMKTGTRCRAGELWVPK